MEFEFSIPTSHQDLLNSDGNKYCVNRVFSTNEIPEKLKAAKSAFTSGDSVIYIFDHFDTYFSVIENAANLQPNLLLNTTSLLYLSVDKLGKHLSKFLTGTNISPTERHEMLIATKMLVYLSVANVKEIDKFVKNANDKIIKKGRKQVTSSEVEILQWDHKRYNALLQLFNIIQLPLENLWDPPVAEESFVNLCADLAYRTLEHPSIKNRDVSNTVFQILGTAIKRFNHAMTFPVRILQILETCEAAIVPVANGLGVLFEEFGITSIFSVLVKELLEHLSADVGGDTQASKHFAMFLTEVASTEPQMMIPHVSTLADEILNLESHTLRNCILQIESDIVITKLTSEDLSEELRETRDEFLDDMLNHMQDISAHVRSRVLQLWGHMKTQNSVPLIWQHRVLTVAVERLEDKSNLVRKNAISLIKAFLDYNPFSSRLSIEELQEQFEVHKKETQEVREKMIQESSKMQTLEKEWEEILEEMHPHIEEVLQMESVDSLNVPEDKMKDIVNYFGECVEAKKFKDLIAAVRKGDEIAGNAEDLKKMPLDMRMVYYENLLRSYFLLRNNYHNYEEEFKSAETKMKFYEDFIEFSKIMINAVPKLQELLMSKTNSDVFEAIDFFTTGYLFGIKDTECGMQQMLYLMWSSDKEKREAVTSAYKRVLWKTDVQGRAHSVGVVRNLIKFLRGLTDGHYIAFEELIKEWVVGNDIDSQIIQVMFEVYAKKLDSFNDDDARLALQLLIMSSAAKPSISTANIENLQMLGFQERGKSDLRIFSASLSMLMNSIPDQTENLSKYYKRVDATNESVQKVLEIFKQVFFCEESVDFDDICCKVFSYIFKMCKKPDVISQDLVQEIYEKMVKISEELRQKNVNSEMGEDGMSQPLTQMPVLPTQTQSSQVGGQKEPLLVSNLFLTRFVFMIGYVTMRELIYLDIDVYSNLKYRQELKDQQKHTKKNLQIASSATSAKRKTMLPNESATSAKRLSEMPQQPNPEETEEDLIGATADDTVADQITLICEKEMLYSAESLLRKFVAVVTEILKFPQKFRNQELQQTAVLSLIRIMSVSSVFCEDNIPFLMNVFQHSKNVKIKCNIIIGMSDFTFRFPNVIEPWSGQLYSTLHEKDNELRLTAVKILAHLISHEMILVKGQISDLAMCIVDETKEIRVITEQFFKEIANKSNILYNALPDIISRLSDVNLNLEESKYQLIMKYIIGLINKDRQVESLVEKLCFRFKITAQERQWRDIAYCLSLLNYNEKTIKKLIENVKFFKDKVQVQEVYDSFRTIISNTSKLAKPELKTVVQEFEAKLEECLAVNDGDVPANTSNEGADLEGTISTAMGPPKRPPVRSKQVQKGKKGGKPVKQMPPPRRGGRNRRAADSSSESESDEEVENLPPQNKGKNKKVPAPTPTRSARVSRHKVIEESSSSDDDQTIKPNSKRGRKNP